MFLPDLNSITISSRTVTRFQILRRMYRNLKEEKEALDERTQTFSTEAADKLRVKLAKFEDGRLFEILHGKLKRQMEVRVLE